MKKLENIVNYVNTSPFWNYCGIFLASAAVNDAAKGNWESFTWNTLVVAMDAGFGYADFTYYKKIKTIFEKGWDEEKVDQFINKDGGLTSRYIARRAAEQTGYDKEFDELVKRKNYKFFTIFNSRRSK